MVKKLIIIISLILLALLSYSYLLLKNEVNKRGDDVKQTEQGMSLEEFNKRIANPNKLVLVYFNADWCVPCKRLKPEIAALETEKKDVCEILKLDVDDNPLLAEYFEINTLPMFLLYKNGKKLWENHGYQSKQQLQSKIDDFEK